MNYRNIILETINKGETVICDRFHFSTIVYQGMCENCKEVSDLHDALNDYFSEYISLIVYLDVDVDTLRWTTDEYSIVDSAGYFYNTLTPVKVMQGKGSGSWLKLYWSIENTLIDSQEIFLMD